MEDDHAQTRSKGLLRPLTLLASAVLAITAAITLIPRQYQNKRADIPSPPGGVSSMMDDFNAALDPSIGKHLGDAADAAVSRGVLQAKDELLEGLGARVKKAFLINDTHGNPAIRVYEIAADENRTVFIENIVGKTSIELSAAGRRYPVRNNDGDIVLEIELGGGLDVYDPSGGLRESHYTAIGSMQMTCTSFVSEEARKNVPLVYGVGRTEKMPTTPSSSVPGVVPMRSWAEKIEDPQELEPQPAKDGR